MLEALGYFDYEIFNKTVLTPIKLSLLFKMCVGIDGLANQFAKKFNLELTEKGTISEHHSSGDVLEFVLPKALSKQAVSLDDVSAIQLTRFQCFSNGLIQLKNAFFWQTV
jgi:hypothetical protein